MAVECSRNSILTCTVRGPRRGARPRPRDNRSQQPTRFQIYMWMCSGSRSYTMKFSIGWILFVIDGSSDLAETNASMRRTLPSLSYHKHNAHGQHSKETSGGIPPHGSCLQRQPDTRYSRRTQKVSRCLDALRSHAHLRIRRRPIAGRHRVVDSR